MHRAVKTPLEVAPTALAQTTRESTGNSAAIIIVIIINFLTPVLNSQGTKKLRYAIQKSTKLLLLLLLLLLWNCCWRCPESHSRQSCSRDLVLTYNN